MSALSWQRDGRNWPHRECSDFIQADDLRFHVQRMGEGPALLLLHGTGASAHSWHRVMPLLAKDYTVVAPDLPLHAFTGGEPVSRRAALSGMVRAIAALLQELQIAPAAIVGHSAGAAIALEMARVGIVPQTTTIIGFNPALTPFPGAAAQVFPGLAKLLLLNPFVPKVFSGVSRFAGDPKRFLERSTGSQTDPVSLQCYAKMFANSNHARGALAMMAHWDLETFSKQLGEIANPIQLIHSRGDLAVPLGSVEGAAARLPNARLDVWDGLGHLAHEESPHRAAQTIAQFVAAQMRGAN
ncbi:Pimeloyl-(acyl-carrier protein) methyl ester esterase [Altererythrobacter insulae]|nr:Pimeloyl-(acyl-carrier protein) methyl ester esterase [Altererythrobacter insulae]